MLVFCVCVRFSRAESARYSLLPPICLRSASDLLPVCCRFAADLPPTCCRSSSGLPLICRQSAADLPPVCCRSASDLLPVSLRFAVNLLPICCQFSSGLPSICCRSAFYVPVSVNMLPLFCRFRAGVSPIACRRLRSASVASAPYATGFVLRWLGFRFCRVSCRCRASSAFRLPLASVSAYAGIPFFRSNPCITPTRRSAAAR